MGPPLQRKGPGRVLLPLQAPSRKSSLLSKLTLAPAIRSYSTTASFTASISSRRDTKCDVISERGNPCRKAANERDTAQCRTCPLIPKPAQEGLQREDIEKRRQRAALPDRTLDHDHPRTPSVHLHHCLRVVVHHAHPSAELRFESGSLQNRRQEPMVNPIEGLNWSARLRCRLLSPLGPRESSAGCPGSIFPSQQRSVRADQIANDKL